MENQRYYFMTPPLMTGDRRDAKKWMKRNFDNVEVKITAEGTMIAVDSKLMPVEVEGLVNDVLFGLKIPGAERIDPPE